MLSLNIMKGKTAIVIGATGLVGKELLKQLLEDAAYEKVVAFSRRDPGLKSPKLELHLIDFGKRDEWEKWVQGDVLFSALGTTMKQAGSKEAQYLVDYTFQHQFAEAASQNGVAQLVLISSVGADANSSIFYSRIKGELDRDVQKLAFDSVHVMRPGPLTGERENPRGGEAFLKLTMGILNSIGLFRKYKPISGTQVAEAMRIVASKSENGAFVHEPLQIFELLD